VLGLAVAIALGTAVIAGAPAAADPLPRVEHVTQALAAVRGLGANGRDQLDRALYATARAQCHADTGTPTASCLIAAARAVCASDTNRPSCEAAADVIVANLRAAATWVDEATRFRLLRGSTDYHAALATELHRRYATLAVELVLDGGTSSIDAAGATPGSSPGDRPRGTSGGVPGSTAGGTGDAAAIDQLCAHRDRAIHACQPGDTACVPSLPWSRCIAALVWFVGGGT
jgi:hypothetical protein